MGITKQGWEKRKANGNGSSWNKGMKGVWSDETLEKMSLAAIGKHLGKNNGNWKGGTTKLGFQIRNSLKNRQWRSDIFERDDYTCQECGTRGGRIEAHHKKEFSKILTENNIKCIDEALMCEELWNINNGITLCKTCHKIENGKQMKNNKYALKNTNT